MSYNNTNVSSKGMTLKETESMISKIKSDYGLGYMKIEEEWVGDEVKFVKFSASIKIDNGNGK